MLWQYLILSLSKKKSYSNTLPIIIKNERGHLRCPNKPSNEVEAKINTEAWFNTKLRWKMTTYSFLPPYIGTKLAKRKKGKRCWL